MISKVLLTFNTDAKIDTIKCVRVLFAWGLYEAKEAVENGIIFDSIETLHNFMVRLQGSVAPTNKVTFGIVPVKRGGVPQDASGLTIWL
jgi:hypothetical protein